MYLTDSHPSITIAESSVSVDNELCIAARGNLWADESIVESNIKQFVFWPDSGKKKMDLLKDRSPFKMSSKCSGSI